MYDSINCILNVRIPELEDEVASLELRVMRSEAGEKKSLLREILGVTTSTLETSYKMAIYSGGLLRTTGHPKEFYNE